MLRRPPSKPPSLGCARARYSSSPASRLVGSSRAFSSSTDSGHREEQRMASPGVIRKPQSTSFTPNPRNTYQSQFLQLPSRFGKNQNHSIPDETRRKLERIAGGFRAVRWGVAYGSGVFDQVGYASNASSEPSAESKETAETSSTSSTKSPTERPMVDLIFTTAHPTHFHALNMSRNPSHYPLIFRWAGPGIVTKVQEWAGGVWFVTDVEVELDPLPTTSEDKGLEPKSETVKIKYGIISLDSLCTDLLDWTTLYVSGRLHKPVRIIKGQTDQRVLVAAQVNLVSALRVGLLGLPERFTERELWEQVAGISYSGDPRMSIPGAENPHKVKNIVSPQIHRFRGLYGRLLYEMKGVVADEPDRLRGVKLEVGGPVDEKRERELAWRATGLGVEGGEGILRQDKSPEYRANLLSKLPRTLRRSIATHYCTHFHCQILKPGEEAPQRSAEEASVTKVYTSEQFWDKVAREEERDLQVVLNRSLKGIMSGPAMNQSLKGLLTAGLRKSVVYAGRKMGKWWSAKTASKVAGSRSYSTGISRQHHRSSRRDVYYQQIRHASNNAKVVRDGQIPFKTVQLVSSEDNSLGPPRSLSSILSSYSTKTHYLHLVSSNPPIVKLIEKKAQQEKTVMQEKKAKAKRARVMETSEVQITWESAKGDLMHKIALVRGILERGDRVEIAFIHKPANTGNLLTGAALKKVQESFPALTKDELAGIAREWKEDRVEPAMRVIYLEPTKEIRDEVLKKLDESADEKSRAKEAKKAERRAKEEERLKRAKARAG